MAPSSIVAPNVRPPVDLRFAAVRGGAFASTSAGVAERVAGRAESIAKALVSYGRHPPGGQSRDNLVTSVELLMERMRVEWFCLTMQHRLEVQEAASAGQDETHQPN